MRTQFRIGITGLALFAVGGVALAQLEPEGSSAIVYFPHLVDGGSAAGEQWRTTIRLTNTNHLNRSASVELYVLDDEGRELSLDFGNGPSARHRVVVPANGMRVLTSRGASSEVRSGWAIAAADYPVQGSVAFRQWLQGRPNVEVTAHGALPTLSYASAATPQVGVALANPWDSPLTVTIGLRDRDGFELISAPVVLPALGHRAFNVSGLVRGLPADFLGTLTVSAVPGNPPKDFVAWTVYADSAVITSLPSGRFPWPVAHYERIWTAFRRIHAAAEAVFPDVFRRPVSLKLFADKVVNAYARAGEEVGVYQALSELIGDADSELAFVIAHEMAHIWQQRTGQRSPEPELEADSVGTLLLLLAGYDPYSGAGALGKLQVASDMPGLLGEALREESRHRSFATRIGTISLTLNFACNFNAQMQALCRQYKSIIHPHFPDSLPLERPGAEPAAEPAPTKKSVERALERLRREAELR